MSDLSTPLTDHELDQLEDFLLNRFDDEEDTLDKDEGIFDISTLDGFFTAVVSGPELIAPSLWIIAIWGDFEPEWPDEKAFGGVFSLLLRFMNSITDHLMIEPGSFEPIFMQREVEGKVYTIVDEWCSGYIKGVELCAEKWQQETTEMASLLHPIQMFGLDENWDQLKRMSEQEVASIRQKITPSARAIHAYWLARREDLADFESQKSPVRREHPRVGRNDPCPCGSGRKYKKCCLH